MTVVLAISGSLRQGSANGAIVEAARVCAPTDVQVHVFDGLGALPPFNRDLDVEPFPPSVVAWRGATRCALHRWC